MNEGWFAIALVLVGGSACSSSGGSDGTVSWGGLTGTIAFVADSKTIGVLRSDERHSVLLGTFDGAALWPGSVALSPDGRRISYAAYRHDYGGYQVFVMNVDGSGVRRISQPGSTAPVWSPDGSELFYLAGGGGAGPVTSFRFDGDVTTTLPFASYQGCAPSPSGERFVVAAIGESGVATSGRSIRIVSRDGTELFSFPSGTETAAMSPAWSPDGNRVAFVSRHGPNDGAEPYYFDIGLIDLARGNARSTVIHWPFDGYATDPHAVFSPDGERLLFDGWNPETGGAIELFSIALDGSGLTRVTNAGGSGPSWAR